MFFSISPGPDKRFDQHDQIGEFCFSHDSGWVQQPDQSWFKGYNHGGIDHGSYTKILGHSHGLEIHHDRLRPYPLWHDPTTQTLTNLVGTGDRIWADQQVMLSGADIKIQQLDINRKINTDEISLDQAVDEIATNLVTKVSCLRQDYHGTAKKLFITGGIDTALLLAMLRYTDVEFENVDYEYFQYDYFTNTNISAIKSHHWAYSQIHHWSSHCMLITGSGGDEFFFRGPYYIAKLMAWHDIDILKILAGSPNSYHAGYFFKDNNRQIFEQWYQSRHQLRQQYPTKRDLTAHLLDALSNDHQHWHLGNTLTWTPFKDLEIIKLILRLPVDVLIDQVINTTINRRLIKQLYPRALELISGTKNINNREYLHNILDY